MASKYLPILSILILFILFTDLNAIAQPTLPDIAGAEDRGIVILSWTSQYDGIKSITVLRSSDSVNGYSVIGKVKKLDKGTQAFVDGHPMAGRNYYKLIILFKSALTWSSNHCSVNIERKELEKLALHLPSNDSLQRYIVTSDTIKPGKINTVAAPTTTPAIKDNLAVDPEDDPEPNESKTKKTGTEQTDDDASSNDKPDVAKRKTYISLDLDTLTRNTTNTNQTTDKQSQQHKKITISFDEPADGNPAAIRSLYIFTDPVTSNVNINLPADVATHHYSIKFYNADNHMILEVPKINSSKVILDKRNFQHKGTYKFALRKDVVELEQGYIEIK